MTIVESIGQPILDWRTVKTPIFWRSIGPLLVQNVYGFWCCISKIYGSGTRRKTFLCMLCATKNAVMLAGMFANFVRLHTRNNSTNVVMVAGNLTQLWKKRKSLIVIENCQPFYLGSFNAVGIVWCLFFSSTGSHSWNWFIQWQAHTLTIIFVVSGKCTRFKMNFPQPQWFFAYSVISCVSMNFRTLRLRHSSQTF